ncbi:MULTISPECIES: MFS transporter [Micromonospora]|uniref:Predicted arabinose efflux permease, MFS family n=1 Tax=Micromonospora yangpuensis TaxID=683228 RepID=A0A1C6V3C5_9ACTN|nr:MFS transporter [Micromonospora yangpuensis]GGM15139.1 MFS transporter [Micromonospora yangpuensis]SCL60899.1 Predicted arabinose efflux permease, MFS family [Micromonospora yangpuensis]
MTVTKTPGEQEKSGDLWGNQGFRRLFAAATFSHVGSEITFVALPLVAVIVLDASAAQVGMLWMLKFVAFLTVGLPAGALLDRTRKRWVMVSADLGRALLLGSIPLAWALDVLTIEQLYLVTLLTGVGDVFFDVASRSYLPLLVGRRDLLAANSRLSSVEATSTLVGPSLAGYIVQFLSAPIAILIDAVTFAWSALFLGGVRHREPRPERPENARLIPDIREGIRFVWGHPLLRPIVVAGALTNLFLTFAIVAVPLVLVRELGLGGGAVGVFFTFGGLGVLLGVSTATWVCRWLGAGQSLWILGLVGIPFGFLVPMMDVGPWQWVASAAWSVIIFRVGHNNVVLVSFRQRVTPDHLLSRMNATMRFVMNGMEAVAAALAGLLATLLGVRPVLWIAAVGLAVAWLPIVFSPLRSMTSFDSAYPGAPVTKEDDRP